MISKKRKPTASIDLEIDLDMGLFVTGSIEAGRYIKAGKYINAGRSIDAGESIKALETEENFKEVDHQRLLEEGTVEIKLP